MIRLLGNPKTLCTGVTRRDLLQIGGLAGLGIGLPDLLRHPKLLANETHRDRKFGQAKSCILIYKYGSPPQHETFDPKPEAPSNVQGAFQAIPTNLPGVMIGEHLPKIAGIMDRLTVVRSLSHPYPLHGTVYATTGIPDVDTKIEAQPRNKRQWPYIGSLVDYFEDQRQIGSPPAMPRNVAIPFPMGSKTELPPLAGPYGAMLGMHYDPVFTDFPFLGTGPSPEIGTDKIFHDPQMGIRPTDRLQLSGVEMDNSLVSRMELRRSLLEQFDRVRRNLDRNERTNNYSLQQQMAFSLVTSGKLHSALDYTLETPTVRDTYGMTLFGQSCLAARRLIEAGTKFVTVFFDAYGLNAGSWDTHHNHFARLKDFLLPVFDQTFTALSLDLEERGLLDETLVLVLSEHGRTPDIDNKPRGGGRHHWSRAYSQVYAGGGMGRGQVIGRTDKFAGDVIENPISPKDILATAFHLLGIDPDSTFPDPEGRPMPITGTGQFRPELLG